MMFIWHWYFPTRKRRYYGTMRWCMSVKSAHRSNVWCHVRTFTEKYLQLFCWCSFIATQQFAVASPLYLQLVQLRKAIKAMVYTPTASSWNNQDWLILTRIWRALPACYGKILTMLNMSSLCRGSGRCESGSIRTQTLPICSSMRPSWPRWRN